MGEKPTYKPHYGKDALDEYGNFLLYTFKRKDWSKGFFIADMNYHLQGKIVLRDKDGKILKFPDIVEQVQVTATPIRLEKVKEGAATSTQEVKPVVADEWTT